MQLTKLTVFAATLAGLTTAIPNADQYLGKPHRPDLPNEPNLPHHPHPSHTNLTGPDARFESIRLAHPHAEIHINKRDDVYGVYECSHSQWSGKCRWTQLMPGNNDCHNQAYGDVGSMGPDLGVDCTVYEDRDCNTKAGFGIGRRSADGFKYPGCGDCPNSKWLMKNGMDSCPRSWRCRIVGGDGKWDPNKGPL